MNFKIVILYEPLGYACGCCDEDLDFTMEGEVFVFYLYENNGASVCTGNFRATPTTTSKPLLANALRFSKKPWTANDLTRMI